ncbi:hypothetical protein BH11PSE8_BH11PSE8_08010 [soil metagenome]
MTEPGPSGLWPTGPLRWPRLPCLAAAMLLSACETLKPPPPPPPPPEPVIREVQVPVEVFVKVPEVSPADTAARNFFAYFDRARQMAPSELGREFQRLDPPTNAAAVLEMATALGQTRNPSDTVRALGLLEPLLKSTDPQMAPYQPLARLLAARYNEQRRLEDHIERQNQQLKDSQRKQEQLQQQLEALKAIERSLTARRSAAASAPAAAASGSKAAP